MNDPRIIGHVISVSGFRVKVELLPEARSPSRATLDGVQKAVAINAYLVFSIGAGMSVVGLVTDLEARESYDPKAGEELTLELTKPRRIALIQLLGTIERKATAWFFDPGITILPTLDTPAEIGSPAMLKSVFETPPQRNKPEVTTSSDFDFELDLGWPTGQRSNRVRASYNDLLSRPLAIVGNTGSGKSYTVASLIQKAMNSLGETAAKETHILILDINGEYARAFGIDQPSREPDRVYVNGREFGVPIWLFNAQEVCAWLSAAEQTQEPVLKDWWAIAKRTQQVAAGDNTTGRIQSALTKLDELISALDGKGQKKRQVRTTASLINQYLEGQSLRSLEPLLVECRKVPNTDDWLNIPNEPGLRASALNLQIELRETISDLIRTSPTVEGTADTPRFIPLSQLTDPSLINRAVSQEDAGRIETHLTTLKLRLKTRLDDKRWWAFLNYEHLDSAISDLQTWLEGFGFGNDTGARVSVVDLSMLGDEILPYACGVIGRTLLEARERLSADKRFETPWVIVLEEAHNYARPARQLEDRGQALSRAAFERIAKEGRKFGVSLVVASQRPSEISSTIISQCANFISHRLQNPDDIEHFRRIVPIQARRLLDQVTVLASGEAIVFGSAFQVPARVQIDRPQPPPWSQTAAPYYEWKKPNEHFPIAAVVEDWGLSGERAAKDKTTLDDIL